jgi:hypothetical protein
MLPLRSRTSWRLRALTVACLPRDWTWAGVYHLANNRRRGHDLARRTPRRARGTSLGYQAHPPVLGLADPRALQVRQDPGTRQALSRRLLLINARCADATCTFTVDFTDFTDFTDFSRLRTATVPSRVNAARTARRISFRRAPGPEAGEQE